MLCKELTKLKEVIDKELPKGIYEVDNLTAIFPLQFEEKAWKITIEEAE